MATSSLKLPDDVKPLAVAAAKIRGVSTHAYMVEAIRAAASAEEKRAEFVAEAIQARSETLRSAKGYAASEVRQYIRKQARGQAEPMPEPKPWRK